MYKTKISYFAVYPGIISYECSQVKLFFVIVIRFVGYFKKYFLVGARIRKKCDVCIQSVVF